MQLGHRYELSAPLVASSTRSPTGLTPKQMLELGVFCCKYIADCRDDEVAPAPPLKGVVDDGTNVQLG